MTTVSTINIQKQSLVPLEEDSGRKPWEYHDNHGRLCGGITKRCNKSHNILMPDYYCKPRNSPTFINEPKSRFNGVPPRHKSPPPWPISLASNEKSPPKIAVTARSLLPPYEG